MIPRKPEHFLLSSPHHPGAGVLESVTESPATSLLMKKTSNEHVVEQQHEQALVHRDCHPVIAQVLPSVPPTTASTTPVNRETLPLSRSSSGSSFYSCSGSPSHSAGLDDVVAETFPEPTYRLPGGGSSCVVQETVDLMPHKNLLVQRPVSSPLCANSSDGYSSAGFSRDPGVGSMTTEDHGETPEADILEGVVYLARRESKQEELLFSSEASTVPPHTVAEAVPPVVESRIVPTDPAASTLRAVDPLEMPRESPAAPTHSPATPTEKDGATLAAFSSVMTFLTQSAVTESSLPETEPSMEVPEPSRSVAATDSRESLPARTEQSLPLAAGEVESPTRVTETLDAVVESPAAVEVGGLSATVAESQRTDIYLSFHEKPHEAPAKVLLSQPPEEVSGDQSRHGTSTGKTNESGSGMPAVPEDSDKDTILESPEAKTAATLRDDQEKQNSQNSGVSLPSAASAHCGGGKWCLIPGQGWTQRKAVPEGVALQHPRGTPVSHEKMNNSRAFIQRRPSATATSASSKDQQLRDDVRRLLAAQREKVDRDGETFTSSGSTSTIIASQGGRISEVTRKLSAAGFLDRDVPQQRQSERQQSSQAPVESESEYEYVTDSAEEKTG
ncbi:unnamed protein product [Amoebophrya sp. A25]|nr:unnamed protein product [Amoebophrya sp. A25]|eukprot:GSA25T00014236001.1